MLAKQDVVFFYSGCNTRDRDMIALRFESMSVTLHRHVCSDITFAGRSHVEFLVC